MLKVHYLYQKPALVTVYIKLTKYYARLDVRKFFFTFKICDIYQMTFYIVSILIINLIII